MKRRQFLASAGATAGAALGSAALLPGAARATGRNTLPEDAPLSVARVGLRSRDAEALAGWYESVLGLDRLETDGPVLRLGAGGQVLLEVTGDSALRRPFPSWAGLYHTAFLLPERHYLGQWLRQAVERQVPMQGASDHRVSEALYLADPEGNGVEIYTDRPQESWTWTRGQVSMGSERLDIDSLMREASRPPVGGFRAPEGTVVGHVHLQVGNALAASAWWHDEMGFELVRGSREANFLSTGGYHHHIAVNEWNSRGAVPMQPGYAGLDHITLRSRDGAAPRVVTDPWGIEVRIEA